MFVLLYVMNLTQACFIVQMIFIYRPYSNDGIGYADTGDDSLNSIGSFEEKVADHMLAVYVRGVYQNDCFSYLYVHIK